ncbi:GNAT superfamily N-acetyltransferase [Catenuloplanes niger]|uniref:GNAT superfamily N-acetyltransferase n=2 Tax=Micromonosporaceae TaxID=28056 RepID=A0AAE4A055_9ACTN|nr:GNAT superfamily N-acetyltransferase [Catenuloplanes niger]
MPMTLRVRADVTDKELNGLFAASWPGHRARTWAPVHARSLAWITARSGRDLVGYINVATDGGMHAFLLDTTVHPAHRRRGLGRRLVREASAAAGAAGASWLHVDYEPHLDAFYRGCGFTPTAAGVVRLR